MATDKNDTRARSGTIAHTAAERDAEPAGAGDGHFLLRFLRLAGPYFVSDEKWSAWGMAAAVVALTLLQIGIQIRLNWWNKDFFDALEQRNWDAFIGQMLLFAGWASAGMITAVYQLYMKQLLQLHWRRWVTNRLVHAWLEDGRHYQLSFLGPHGIDNPDQRISENVRNACEMATEFALGVMNAVLTLVSFVGILWVVSGALTLEIGGTKLEIPGYMVYAAVIYAILGSGLTWLVGRPIVAANLRQTAAEADYRFALMRLREYSESVALIRGEPDEIISLHGFFGRVIDATRYLMRTQRRLMWLTSGYGMVGMVFPTLVASPRYFSGAITLGGLMQITGAFVQVQGSLTWFVDNFPRLAEWRSHVERLLELEQVLGTTLDAMGEDEESVSIVVVEENQEEEQLAFEALQIAHSDGSVVIAEANAKIARGERVLIVGDSGSGKSTLFRAIAGLWPWGAGTIYLPPRGQMMFMPQRPYLPLGSLRAAVTYPAPPKKFSKKAVRAVLDRVGLGQLADRLDEQERWDKVLSGGEQQRVAFARLLLHKPGWVFLDEATSALDDDSQNAMLQLLRDELPDSTVISIAHRPGMEQFHERTLGLVKSARGARLVTKRREGTAPPKSAKLQPSFRKRLMGRLRRRGAPPHHPAPQGRGPR
jgi:putative ATP-binding cassette transporter